VSGSAPIDPAGASRQGPRNDKAGLRKAAEAFESIFVQILLQRMRSAQLTDGMFGSGAGSHVYEGMFDRYLAERVSQGSPFGIARLLEEEWSRAVDGTEQAGKAMAMLDRAQAKETYGNVIEGSRVSLQPAVSGSVQKAVRSPEGISSGFGWRTDPIDGTRKFHHGVDLPAAEGTPAMAMRRGRVESAGKAGGYGLQVVIEHPGGWKTRYAHLSRIDVREGQWIRRGQVIGRTGDSGRSTGPHLHLETILGGRATDPRRFTNIDIRSQVLGFETDKDKDE
jgi:murein DD-endopeptidase MepM/ murein hydrolase activator NlpD